MAQSDVAVRRVSAGVKPAKWANTGKARGKSWWNTLGMPASVEAMRRTPASRMRAKDAFTVCSNLPPPMKRRQPAPMVGDTQTPLAAMRSATAGT